MCLLFEDGDSFYGVTIYVGLISYKPLLVLPFVFLFSFCLIVLFHYSCSFFVAVIFDILPYLSILAWHCRFTILTVQIWYLLVYVQINNFVFILSFTIIFFELPITDSSKFTLLFVSCLNYLLFLHTYRLVCSHLISIFCSILIFFYLLIITLFLYPFLCYMRFLPGLNYSIIVLIFICFSAKLSYLLQMLSLILLVFIDFFLTAVFSLLKFVQ